MQAMYNMKRVLRNVAQLTIIVLLSIVLVPFAFMAIGLSVIAYRLRRQRYEEEDERLNRLEDGFRQRFRRTRTDDCCDQQELYEVDRYEEYGKSKVRCRNCGWMGLATDYAPEAGEGTKDRSKGL